MSTASTTSRERTRVERAAQHERLPHAAYLGFGSRLLFRHCVDSRVSIVGTDYDRRWLPLILPMETAKLVWALVSDRGC